MIIRQKIESELNQFPSHSATEMLKIEITQLNDDELDHFGKHIDSTEHGLHEWLSALIAFNLWLQREKRRMDFIAKIDYLHCCAEGGQQTGGMLSLTDLFHDYVKLYGVE